MNLFEFQLKPLKDIVPWGGKTEQFLSWFGLTDGFYHINVGDEQLYRYSQEILNYWSKEYPQGDNLSQPYMDYQVSRLYQDLMANLPDIRQPIPKNIFSYISTHQKQIQWEQAKDTIDWLEEEADQYDDFYDIFLNATEWMFPRKFQGLGGCPGITIFRTDNTIYIRWENKDIKQDGFQTWSSTSGEYTLAFDDFMNEVKSFHNRFMQTMATRVHIITTTNPLPHINIDLIQLAAEQKQSEQLLDNVLNKKPQVNNWDMIKSSISQLF